jgi:CheY-like chemotaxis protein
LIKFEIEDSGVGVGPTEIDQLFQAFGQTSSGINIGEGTGLGLVISKKFVELLGGEIYLESKVGQGATFSFKIPVQEVSKNETTLASQITKVVGLEPGQPCYRLLIVDDKWDNRQLLVRMLDSYGFELREAESGQEALDIQEVWEPDLIWMDIRMPGIDGLEAAKLIRAQASHIKQPVIIAVTAGVLQTQLEALLREVCDDIIIKPFKENNLFEVLRKYLNIKFLYESVAKTGESLGLKTEKFRVSPSDFHALPKEIVLQLKKSVTALKLSSVLDTIEEIRKRDEPLADALHKLAIEFRFDILQQLLNQSEQP